MILHLLAHNIRSVHNVGSILRTADGFGVEKVCFSGYTPYPALPGDTRPPHVRNKLMQALHKTALSAEQTMAAEYADEPAEFIGRYQALGYRIVGLEQAPGAVPLQDYHTPEKLLLVLGEEVHGIPPDVLELCDETVVIPMLGHKESFNVSVATGIALYGLIFG